MTMTLDGTNGLTTPGVVNTAGETIATTLAVTGASTLTGALTATAGISAPNTFGFKNRIINGAMVIDQRNAGASVASTGYVTDRFAFDRGVSAATVTGQQSSTVPSSGFTKSLVLTVGTGAATAAGDYSIFRQAIEGYNVADFGLGTASAQTFTLSFWVRSSLTGTFGVSFNNAAQNRYYIGSYAISVANTWEQKTVTVAGDTSGTWLTTNGAGMQVYWDIGVGTTYSAAAGAWGTGSGIYGLTGGVKLLANTGATFYITGVQLEKGSTATSFDCRDYGTELAMCQRYLPMISCDSGTGGQFAVGQASSTTNAEYHLRFPVTARTPATGLVIDTVANLRCSNAAISGSPTTTSLTFTSGNSDSARFQAAVASGLVAGNATMLIPAGAAKLYFTGCEL